MGCVNDVLMWCVVAPALGVLVALAAISGDPALLLGSVALAALVLGVYLLASWED